MKFNIGAVSPKTYKHRYNSFNVTTCNPIFVQPTFFRVVMPNSKINCSFKQTLRTLPMPFPSFANVKICNKAFFVPIEDICDNFANLMSEKPYSTNTGTYVPKNLPYVSCAILTDNIIKNDLFCNTKYFANVVGPTSSSSAASLAPAKAVSSPNFDYNERFAPLFDGLDIEHFTRCDALSTSKYLEIRNKFIIDGVDYFDTERVQAIIDSKRGVSSSSRPLRAAANGAEQHLISELDGYDYVNVYNTVDMSDTIHDAQGIQLTAQGAAVVKILNGLGYKFTRSDDTSVNLMPLIAFYKCWFESFYPSRLEDFQETVAGKLIKKFQENQIDFTQWNDPTYSTILYEFIESLGNCFISNPTDFASMHMSALNNEQSLDISALKYEPRLAGISVNNTSYAPLPDSKVPTLSTDSAEPTAYDIKFLLWLQKYINRDSIIGNRIDLWMRSHLNSDVYSRLVARSRVLGYSEFAVNIGDVDSTAQTSNLTANQGAPLGAYAGKAVGSGEFKFKGSFSTYGFVIVLSWYECATDVTQCVDPQLFATNKWTIPQPELDCMGYEVTPKSAFYTDNGICPKGMKLFKDDYATNDKGFGFVPRLSGFKTFRPVVNGDLARRSMEHNYLPFVNRRYLLNNRFQYNGVSPDVTMRANKVPIASARWRWQNAEPVIGGYDNIFAYNNWSALSNNGTLEFGSPFNMATYVDNVILYTSIDLMEVNSLKPLSNSYDTDILKDDGELTVNNN